MTWTGPIKKVGAYRFEIAPEYQSESMKRLNVRMRVPGLVYTDEEMLKAIVADDSPDQVANVATLPGIIGQSIAMPDIHHGYGFPIGGVAAFDAQHGVISPGGVGYDINSVLRLVRTVLIFVDIRSRIPQIIYALFANVPSDVCSEGK